MSELAFLQQRASIPARYLSDPAPDDQQLAEIFKAGVAAPDHAAMRPWQFIVIRDDARHALGEAMAKAAIAREPDLSSDKIASTKEKPLRSPLIIAVAARITPNHPKTPEIEQVLSAGAAAHQMSLAANALGFGSIWLTGPNADTAEVKQALALADTDMLIGFLYLGTATIDTPRPARPDIKNHVTYWSP